MSLRKQIIVFSPSMTTGLLYTTLLARLTASQRYVPLCVLDNTGIWWSVLLLLEVVVFSSSLWSKWYHLKVTGGVPDVLQMRYRRSPSEISARLGRTVRVAYERGTGGGKRELICQISSTLISAVNAVSSEQMADTFTYDTGVESPAEWGFLATVFCLTHVPV